MRHSIFCTIVTILNIGGVSSNSVQCSEVASEERDGWCAHWDTRIVRNYIFAENDICTTLDLCGKCIKSSSVLLEPTDCCTHPDDWMRRDANGCQLKKEYWNGTDCMDVTVCGNNRYQTNTPSSTEDRICVARTTCGPGTHVPNTPSPTEDRTCADCAPGKFSDQPNQQTCTQCTTCSTGEYITGTLCNGRGTSNTQTCTACTSCGTGEYITGTKCDGLGDTNGQTCTGCATACGTGTRETTECTSDTNRVCTQNECYCTDGAEATGDDCTTHGAHICESCDDGFFKNADTKCEPNEEAATGGGNSDSGNVCYCTNGVAAMGEACTTHGAHICESCNGGYYKIGNTCTACTPCGTGTRTTGQCWGGSNYACTQNTCTCFWKSGVAATGEACTTDGANICSSCKTGYYKTGDTCTALPCTSGPGGQVCHNGGSPTGTTGNCGCDCRNGFTGDTCNLCGKGKGMNILNGHCEECTYPTYNDVTTHSAPCAAQECANGWGVTSDNIFVSETGYNCFRCGEGYESPHGAGQCTANDCTPTSVTGSDKSAAGSITGKTGDVVSVTCTGGFQGSGHATCQSDGTFTSVVCAADACAHTQVSHSNKATQDSITGTTGQSVDVICDTGYTSSTTGSSVQCQSSGTFTSMTCNPVACANTEVSHSSKATKDSITGTTGQSVEVTCDTGYTSTTSISSTGSSSVQCQSSGTFTSMMCEPDACAHMQVSHSNKATQDSITGTTGQSVDVICDTGYTSSTTGSSVQCQSSGTFTSMTCNPVACANTEVSHSSKATKDSITGTTGQSVEVTCDTGYTSTTSISSTGSSSVQCQSSGTFTSMMCEPDACAHMQVSHSNKATQDSITGTTGQSVDVICDTGYTSSNPSISSVQCQSSGMFTSITCNPVACVRTRVSNSNKATTDSITGKTGDSVDVTCDTGYTSSNPSISSVQCQSSGTFTLMTCTQNVCSCTNGVIATGDACTTHGANICSSCSGGYYKTGNTCTRFPKCSDEIDCVAVGTDHHLITTDPNVHRYCLSHDCGRMNNGEHATNELVNCCQTHDCLTLKNWYEEEHKCVEQNICTTKCKDVKDHYIDQCQQSC